MFDNSIHVQEIDEDSPIFSNLVKRLEQQFSFKAAEGSGEITHMDHLALYDIAREFYSTTFPSIFEGYVPLYTSLWKLRLKDVVTIANMHQDGGVHYFSNNGFNSRMVTLWTTIYKDKIPGVSESDLGIFVIDNQHPGHVELYKKMAEANTHFYQAGPNELKDIMYPGGGAIPYDSRAITRQCFNYGAGTTIQFNSHLLHGTKPFQGDLASYSTEDLLKFRVALTSVWLHKDDLNHEVLATAESDHERIYLARHEKSTWPEVREKLRNKCLNETIMLKLIKELIQAHA